MKLAFTAALLALFVFWEPAAEPSLRLCGLHWLTGLPCPLCGLTRALCALAKGRWTEAVAFHALSPAVFLAIAGVLFSEAAAVLRGRPAVTAPAFVWRSLVIALGVYGASRWL